MIIAKIAAVPVAFLVLAETISVMAFVGPTRTSRRRLVMFGFVLGISQKRRRFLDWVTTYILGLCAGVDWRMYVVLILLELELRGAAIEGLPFLRISGCFVLA